MNTEERQIAVNHMHRAIDIAVDIWTLIADAPLEEIADGVKVGSIHIDQILAEVGRNWKVPLPTARQQALGHALTEAIGEHGVTSCGLWHFAHLLDHVLFEEDLSAFL